MQATYAAISLIIESHTLQFLPFRVSFHLLTFSLASFFASASIFAETLIVLLLLSVHPQVLQSILVFILSEFIFLCSVSVVDVKNYTRDSALYKYYYRISLNIFSF